MAARSERAQNREYTFESAKAVADSLFDLPYHGDQVLVALTRIQTAGMRDKNVAPLEYYSALASFGERFSSLAEQNGDEMRAKLFSDLSNGAKALVESLNPATQKSTPAPEPAQMTDPKK